MIFDFYLSFCFDRPCERGKEIRFKTEREYEEIVGTEVSGVLKQGSFTCLHRRSYTNSFHEKEGKKLWVFGYVYSNKKHNESHQAEPSKLSAFEIFELSQFYGESFVHFLKGAYVLVFVDEVKGEVEVITDRLNVLPLYFAYADNKLILSSNTALILKANWVNREIDQLSMAMQQLFDYMLGEHYFVKGIRRFENARRYRFSVSGMERQVYWDVSQLYYEKLLPKWDSLELLAEQLRKNVNLYASDAEKVLVSLTGGFDGRTNLALLDRPTSDFRCYSYGMPGSSQILVPQKIAQHTGIDYTPIYLDQSFLDTYYENSLLASYFSNGTAPVGFCNKPYTYRKLNAYSDTIITGLFGSEILRPIHNNGIQVNDQSFDIFLNNNLEEGLQQAIDRVSLKPLMDKVNLQASKEALVTFFQDQYFKKYSSYDKITRFFFFIIQEGIRKYFSQEISLERVFVTTRFPYFDTDLVDLIYQTPWAGMYNGFLGESKFKRRKGQLLYAYVMQKYKPVLGQIVLDRGYRPKDLLLPFPINYLKIGAGVYKAKAHMRKAGGNDTFKTDIWAKPTIDKILENYNDSRKTELSISSAIISDNKLSESQFLTFRHFISLVAFLNPAF